MFILSSEFAPYILAAYGFTFATLAAMTVTTVCANHAAKRK